MNWFSPLWLKKKDKQDPSADSNQKTNTTKITAEELYSAYQENEIAADIKYKGEIIKVTGVTGSIHRDVLRHDAAYVELTSAIYGVLASGKKVKSTTLHITVLCYFNLKDEAQLAQARRGQKITVQGICEGRYPFAYIRMGDCILTR